MYFISTDHLSNTISISTSDSQGREVPSTTIIAAPLAGPNSLPELQKPEAVAPNVSPTLIPSTTPALPSQSISSDAKPVVDMPVAQHLPPRVAPRKRVRC